MKEVQQLREGLEGQRKALSDTQELLSEDPSDVEVQEMVAELQASVINLENELRTLEDDAKPVINVGQQYRYVLQEDLQEQHATLVEVEQSFSAIAIILQ